MSAWARLRDAALTLASRDWAGLLVAAAVAVLTGWVGRSAGGALGDALAVAGLAAGVLLAVASLRHQLVLARARRANPPPGRMIDIGGYRVHLLAEGEAGGGRPPIVWFGGGHASGHSMHHLHRAVRADTRSILIDRPGSGWSDIGPFPRTTAREADEVVRALELAGETGPFVWAGYSFGGLLAANIARRRPDLVHTLVLLDPTPLDTIVFGPRFGALREMRSAAWWTGLALMFGIDLRPRFEARLRARDAGYARVGDRVNALLGESAPRVRAVEGRAGVHFAQWSIYRELHPTGAAERGWETVVYDGDLGELPVWLVAPKNDVDVEQLPETRGGDAEHARRVARLLARTRERYLATSTHSRRIVAPAGSSHQFAYEIPDFVIDVVRGLLRGEAG